MALKRPAEVPADGGEVRASSNPFAGLSLSGAAPAASFAGFGSFSPAPAAASTAPAPSAAGSGNPFAGISLSAQSAPSGSLFTVAAAASGSREGAGFGCPSPSASTVRPAFGEAPLPAESKSGNPFTGLSLFSASPTPSATSGGGLFTSAVSAGSAGVSNTFPVPAPAASEAAVQTEVTAPVRSTAAEDNSEDRGDTQQDSQDATGEEDEEVVYHTECKLWKLVRHAPSSATDSPSGATAGGAADAADAATGASAGSAEDATPEAPPGDAVVASAAAAGQENGWRWQEKGHGILHINRHARTGKGRLVMRMRGVLKLLLNTPVFPTTKYEKVGQKSVRFVGVDPEESDLKKDQVSMCAYRLNLQTSDQQGKFLAVLRDSCSVKVS